jgi:hypothetical protein
VNRTQWIAVAVLAVLAGVIVVLMLRNRQAPVLPADPEHVWRGSEACVACHDADGVLPRSSNHPLGPECLNCHGLAR